jgi:hypothetical protein
MKSEFLFWRSMRININRPDISWGLQPFNFCKETSTSLLLGGDTPPSTRMHLHVFFHGAESVLWAHHGTDLYPVGSGFQSSHLHFSLHIFLLRALESKNRLKLLGTHEGKSMWVVPLCVWGV